VDGYELPGDQDEEKPENEECESDKEESHNDFVLCILDE